MCEAEIETLQNLKEPRALDNRTGATNDVAVDIEIFRVIQLQIDNARDRYNVLRDPAQTRIAHAAGIKLTKYMWREERWTVLPPPGSQFWPTNT